MGCKDPSRASALRSVQGRLRAVKDALAKQAVYERSCGLTVELESAVQHYCSGDASTNFEAQLLTAADERAVIAAAVTSALSTIGTTLASLEI